MTEVVSVRRRAFLGSLGLSNFAGAYAQVVVIPLLSEIAKDFDVSKGSAAAVVAAFGVPGIFLPILAGPSIDRYGRKPFLVGGTLLVLCGALLSVVASTFHALVASRVISGAGAWLTFPSIYATIADRLSYSERGKALSTNMGVSTLASVLGIPISGSIAQAASWRVSIAIMGMISLSAAVALQLFVPPFLSRLEVHRASEYFSSIAANRSTVAAVASSFLGASSWFVWSPFVVVFFQVTYRLTLGVASMLGLTLATGLMAGTLIGGRLGDRYGQKPVMVAAISAACPLVLGLTNLSLHLILAALLNFLAAAAMGARFATTNTLLTEQIPNARGTVMAIAVSTVSIAVVAGAAVGGVLIDGLGFGAVGAAAAALALCSAIAAAALVKEGDIQNLNRRETAGRCADNLGWD